LPLSGLSLVSFQGMHLILLDLHDLYYSYPCEACLHPFPFTGLLPGLGLSQSGLSPFDSYAVCTPPWPWYSLAMVLLSHSVVFCQLRHTAPPAKYLLCWCLIFSGLLSWQFHLHQSNPLTYSASSMRVLAVGPYADEVIPYFFHLLLPCIGFHSWGQRVPRHLIIPHYVLCMSKCSGFSLSLNLTKLIIDHP